MSRKDTSPHVVSHRHRPAGGGWFLHYLDMGDRPCSLVADLENSGVVAGHLFHSFHSCASSHGLSAPSLRSGQGVEHCVHLNGQALARRVKNAARANSTRAIPGRPVPATTIQFLAWLVPTIEKFPKSHKFTIGDRIEYIALNVLEALNEATYTKERTQHLRQAPIPAERDAAPLRRSAAKEHDGKAILVLATVRPASRRCGFMI